MIVMHEHIDDQDFESSFSKISGARVLTFRTFILIPITAILEPSGGGARSAQCNSDKVIARSLLGVQYFPYH